MKSSAIPAVRVSPELRQAVEEALREGESLSSFVEDSVRRHVEFRQAQKAFVDRALASGANAKQTGNYVPASETLRKISERIRAAQKKVRASE
jgi:predicted transcriptional regulator